MALKGKKDGSWVDASAVYGKLGDSWQYAKSVWAKKDGVWQRSWTDCRLFDSGGRDWSSPTTTSTYNGSCAGRTRTDVTTRTKEGCPNDVRSVTVADPQVCDCTYAQYIVVNAYTNTQYLPANGTQMWIDSINGVDPRLVVHNYGYWNDVNPCNVCDCNQYNVADYDIRYCTITGQYRWFDLNCYYAGI